MNNLKSLVTRSCHSETFLSYNQEKDDKIVEIQNAGHSIAMLWTVLGFSTEMSYLVWNHVTEKHFCPTVHRIWWPELTLEIEIFPLVVEKYS